MPTTIAVLLTCHNRRDKTLQCLRLLSSQDLSHDFRLDVILVDDGSTDGTMESVLAEFPETTILRGDGNLYWCGGMRLAWTSAANHNPDYFLLANDDTLLDSNAVLNLVEIVGSPDARTIAVAAIKDPESGLRTYGGLRRGIGIFAKNTAVAVSGKVEPCDTFNANAALVPKAVHQELGIFHEVYTHGMGDYDYGYRASEQGIQVLQSAVFLGTCPRNSTTGTWRDTSLSRLQRFKKLQSPKGLPWKEWGIFNRRNTGWLWLIRTVSPYVKVLFRL